MHEQSAEIEEKSGRRLMGRSKIERIQLRRAAQLVSLAGLILLSGCAGQEQNVRSELKSLTSNVKPKIEPLPTLRESAPFVYEARSLLDPFSAAKLAMAARPGSGSQPDMSRQKDILEAFPLESMAMIGTVTIGNAMYALIQAEGKMYRIRSGQYMGQNFGKVVDINETELKLKETVQTTNGDWVERDATLSLADANEGKTK